MNETSLREALAELPTPEPPADLHARCRATIPPRRRSTFGLRAALVGAALAVALLGAALLPRGKGPAPGVAWADVQKAMDTVTVWHEKGRGHGIPSYDIGAPAWTEARRWREIETWVDFARGMRTRSGLTSHAMTLSNGDVFDRQSDHVAVTYFGGRYWQRIRQQMHEHRRRIVAGSDSPSPMEKRIFRQKAYWKGRPALRFDFLRAPFRRSVDEDSRQGIGFRYEVYVEPQSRRILARCEYAVWTRLSGNPERLVSESEFDYPERIDPAVFDPKAFCAGAAWIHTQNGVDGVITSPP